MKRHPLFLALLLATTPLFAADEAGFKSLFNGKDLTNWEGNKELWSVQDGAITGVTKADPKLTHNTFLLYKGGEVGDFELRLSYRIVAGNSGIQYRSKVLSQGAQGPIVGGYQADFEAGKTYSGILYEERGRGILAQRGQKTVIKAEGEKHKVEVAGSVGKSEDIQAKIKHEDWNDYVVIARGNHLQHFINGQQTVDVVDEHEAKAAKTGILALQIHTGPPMTVQFKNIRLKELKPRADIDLMQGEWVPMELVGNGNAAPADALGSIRVKIEGNRYELKTADGGDSGSFELNPTQSPKWMDVVNREGTRIQAIYEIKDGTMRVCYAINNAPRPTTFAAPEGSDHVFAVYKRP
jgi:uncharacterized protein (TIGR03067 family)